MKRKTCEKCKKEKCLRPYCVELKHFDYNRCHESVGEQKTLQFSFLISFPSFRMEKIVIFPMLTKGRRENQSKCWRVRGFNES